MKIEQRINLKFLVKLEKRTPTEMKRESMQWKAPTSPRKKKERMSKSQLKARMIILFDIRGIIMTEWVHEGQTVNQK
jgi:hypothetical protein